MYRTRQMKSSCCSLYINIFVQKSVQIRSKRIPRSINVLIGQLSGSGAFLLGPLLQVAMATNRFLSLYFAIMKARNSRYPITSIWIGFSIILAVIYTVVGLPEDCGFLYIPEEMLWISEDGECSQFQYDILFYTVLVAGMSTTDSQFRRRMYIRKFSQCVLRLSPCFRYDKLLIYLQTR
ncbi:Protein CBG10914 [Caenorhabditis briggsae]|uniref:Protein CBG10914 n=1 Tax=Caenorhabditis briggsae TaxID=6238 RepID=A8XC94_CAEBR|nr:Protein CBG10914 [Caenorhabditis briggsae]CAP30192.2 Protein CBG10914 [Caenorhabditis briggsae]